MKKAYGLKKEAGAMETIKHPLVFSVLMTLMLLVFLTVSGAIISIVQLGDLPGRLVQTVAFLCAALIGWGIATRKVGRPSVIGFTQVRISNMKDYLWFVPILVVELFPFFFGLKQGLNGAVLLVYVLFTMVVGFTEELYFRGIIAKALQKKSLLYALLGSSLLFACGHLFNLLAGAGLADTMLQIFFAFVFGVVAVEIRFATGSLLIPVLWHISHNFIALVTVSNEAEWLMRIGMIQGWVLLLYGLFLWFKTLRPRLAAEGMGS